MVGNGTKRANTVKLYMNKFKHFFIFIWRDLPFYRSIDFINKYNLISMYWLANLYFAGLSAGSGALAFAFLILWTVILNIIIYVIFFIAFYFELKRKVFIRKNNPVVKNNFYGIITVLSLVVVLSHILSIILFCVLMNTG